MEVYRGWEEVGKCWACPVAGAVWSSPPALVLCICSLFFMTAAGGDRLAEWPDQAPGEGRHPAFPHLPLPPLPDIRCAQGPGLL